jgi:asparagine synthase (glutamine-hydrolysing)
MCGIVGVSGSLQIEKIGKVVKRMNAAIAHRGPDDEGVWVEEGFGFGMTRLSIIDLAGGHQPMWDEKMSIGVVYNGEVYNYRVLREEMERGGVHFKTNSDTEVVLKGLMLKGTRAIHDWNGMFAIACWNRTGKKLTLIRDRIGVKPLYYFWDGVTLIFASEIKALLASGLFQPRLNRQAVWDYLTFRYVPGPETIWHQIWKLPPGHILEWSPGAEPRLHCYWKTDVVSEQGEISVNDKLREFEDLFLDSVQQRLLASDVPVGVLLSGGLDSSTVAAAAVELGHRRFHTFSVGFEQGGDYSELAYARSVAKHVGAEYHEVVIDQSAFLDMLPQAVRAADEPLADLAAIPLLAVSRLARQWVKVVLSGEGSDEILAGYSFGNLVRNFRLIKHIQTLPPSILKWMVGLLVLFPGKYSEKLNKVANIHLSKWGSARRYHMTRHWTQEQKVLLWPSFSGLDSNRIIDDMYATAASENPLEQILSVYQKSWLVEDLLMKADKMTMATSLELRVPFLDYRLVEWANRQRPELKVGHLGSRRYVTKYILRRFAQKRLPREIINRPKQGFPVPAYIWLHEEKVSRWTHECLIGKKSRLKHILSPAEMEDQIFRAARGDMQAAHRTWLLIVLEIWLREYEVEVQDC